ncbi:MAG: hypothetical protein RJA07_1240 [Bacteroidota bacterium]|jgi:predicted nucleic acid-binding protein
MIVVSDTSPILCLIRIEKLFLLEKIFQKIILPKSVFDELVELHHIQPNTLTEPAYIEIVSAKNLKQVNELEQQLDKGEAEAIVISIELNADLLLIDERLGTQMAHQYHLHTKGFLGVLLQAKSMGFINEIKPLIQFLMNEHNYWISEKIFNEVLRLANEK